MTFHAGAAARHGHAAAVDYRKPTGAGAKPLRDLSGNAVAEFISRSVTNNTPPAFSSAAVNGDALTVTFNGGLDPNSRPAAAAFTVTVGGSEVDLAATNPVSISGSEVTLALAEVVLSTETVTVGYTAPADNPLRDADRAKNPVPGFTGKAVTNDTPADTTGPAFVSATANGKTVTVTFDEALDETVTPAWTQFGLVLGEDFAGGVSVRGSIAGRTVTLSFLSPATHGATVKVSYNPSSVASERIKNLSGIEAPGFQQQPATNNTAPAFDSAAVDGDALTVTFDGGLDANSRPAAAAFTVTVAGTEVALAATNPVSVSGSRVRLALAEAVYPVHTVTVGYAAPATGNKLKDADGAKNPVADFTGKAVRNDTDLGDTTGPRFVSATALDDTVVFTYDEELYASANLDRRLFQRNVGDSSAISLATTISVSGNTVTATYVALGAQPGPVRHGDAVWVRYQSSRDATKRLTDLSGNEATGFNLRSATNNTPPAFASAAVDGDALTITFDGDLNANSRPAADAFTVKAGGNEVALAAASPVAISGSTVTLALAEAVYPAHTVTVRYTKPADNPLRDADNARLPVAGFGDKKTVTNNTDLGDTTAPAMVSRGIDGRTLTITYNEPLDESSVPAASRLSAAIGGVGRGPASIRVAGEVVTLTFRADHAARHDQFVAMTYAKQSATKRLRDRSGNQAPGFIGLSVTNNTPPAFASASLNGNALQVTFTGNLDSESRPAADAFTVTVDGAEVALTTGAVGVSGTFATMTLAEPVAASLVPVTVGYTAPVENPLRDADRAKRPVASFSGKAVTNNTASDTTPPMLQSAAVDGETMTLIFGEALDPGSVPPAGSFGVIRGASAAKAPTGVGVAGSTVTLTLAAADAPIRGDAVAVTYSKPTGAGAKPLRDLSANPVAGFTNAVTNNSGVSTPLFASASVNGTALTVHFDRALDGTRVPAKAAFTVTAGGAEVAVADGGVAVGGSAVTLTLAGAVAYGQAVTVGYDRSAAGSATLRDARGSEAESFAGEEVFNVTPAPAATIASVTIESVPSIDADSDDTPETYARGEQIRVRVTWSTEVLWDVSGAGAGMSVGLDVGGTARAARLLSADGSRGRARSLSFGYTVAPQDRDADGIVIARTVAHDVVALSGGATLKDALGRNAVRGGTGAFGRAEGHQVDGLRTVPDKAPALVGATVSGKTVTLTFDEDLAAPADTAETLWALRTAFFVQGGRYLGAPVVDQSPTRVVVSGPTVTLTLGVGVGAGRPVAVSYERPAARHRLRDAAGKEVEDFEGEPVDNTTGRTGPPPALARATVEGRTLTLFFDLGLLDSTQRPAPAGSGFDVSGQADGVDFKIAGTGKTSVMGATVVVTLEKALPATVEDAPRETPTMRYVPGNAVSPLRGADGARVAEIGSFFVAVLEAKRPEPVHASVSGAAMTVNFDEALDISYVPGTAAFEVADSGTAPPLEVDVVEVKGSAVFLTLNRPVEGAESDVSVRYRANIAGGSGRLRDTAGNEAVGFGLPTADRPLSVDPAPEGSPALEEAEVDGDVLTLRFDRVLNPAEVPANDAFTLLSNPFGGVTDVTVRRKEVELRLGREVGPCDGAELNDEGDIVPNDDITLSYAQPVLNALRDRWGTYADGIDREVVKNARIDDCEREGLPRADAGSIILTGRRAFAQDAPPRAAWFTVAASGGPVAVTGAAFDPADPRKIRLSLSRDFAPGETATVSYRRPLGARGLWFVDGKQLADVVDLPVRMRAQAAAPAVEAVAVVSDPGADAAYAPGDVIRVRVTFSAPVTVDTGEGAPRLKLDLGGESGSGERWAAYASGSGETALTFAYTVVSGDASTGGVAVLADTLEANGGTLRSAAGTDAALAHAGLARDAWHRVDTAAPGFASAAVDGATLTVTFDEALDADSAPPASAFTVTAAPADGEARAIAGTGTAGVAGAAVTVTLAEAVAHGETLTVAYAPPDENPIRDLAGNAAAAFSREAAANGTAAPAPAVEAVAVVSDPEADGTYAAGDAIRVRVTFGAPVTVDTAQGAPRLKLDLGGESGSGERWAAYEGGTGTTALSFAYTAVSGDTSAGGVAVLADTLQANGGTLRSAAGADAALAHAGLAPDAGHKVDTTAPGFASAAVDGATLTVTFDEDLDTGAVPAASAFTVTAAPVEGAERAIAGTGTAVVADAAVTVTLAEAVAHGETLTVAYAPPDENPIRDLAGNAAAAFAGEAAANGTLLSPGLAG